MKFFKILNLNQFEKVFKESLEEKISKPKNKSDIYDEIANYYFTLLSILNIDSFNQFRFPDYEDCRKVIVDDKEYDFDDKFSHDDSDATEALCAIDCLIADLGAKNFKTLLKKIEDTVNMQNKNMK